MFENFKNKLTSNKKIGNMMESLDISVTQGKDRLESALSVSSAGDKTLNISLIMTSFEACGLNITSIKFKNIGRKDFIINVNLKNSMFDDFEFENFLDMKDEDLDKSFSFIKKTLVEIKSIIDIEIKSPLLINQKLSELNISTNDNIELIYL